MTQASVAPAAASGADLARQDVDASYATCSATM
jgi:hypothetical protein